jgi:hypothetical protein
MFLDLQFLRPAVAMPATEHNYILMIFPEHNTKGARMCTPKTTGSGPKVSKLQATDSWHTSLTAGMSAVLPHPETMPRPHWLAGAPGFEPGNGGIKIHHFAFPSMVIPKNPRNSARSNQ